VFNVGACMGNVPNKPPNAAPMAAAAHAFAAAGKIDPPQGLRAHRVYVFSGTQDPVVKPAAVDAVAVFYKLMGVEGSALDYVNTLSVGHALMTPAAGNGCPAGAAPFISHCTLDGREYDHPGALLTHIYGKLNPPAGDASGAVLTFDQREFAAKQAAMADEAFVYVPKSCAASPCRLHIAFHGCAQSAKVVGDSFYGKGGYNRWADSNGLIVLYPQVNPSLFNPQGCWDWWGFTGPDYATKAGPQMAAVKAMADRLLGLK
jgi:hypothetical protein